MNKIKPQIWNLYVTTQKEAIEKIKIFLAERLSSQTFEFTPTNWTADRIIKQVAKELLGKAEPGYKIKKRIKEVEYLKHEYPQIRLNLLENNFYTIDIVIIIESKRDLYKKYKEISHQIENLQNWASIEEIQKWKGE